MAAPKKENWGLVPAKGLSPGYIAYTGRDQAQFIKDVAETYHLDPRKGDLLVYLDQGGNPKPYFTKSGLTKIAHISGVKSIMHKLLELNNDAGYVMFECIVTNKDEQVHKAVGYCGRDEPGKGSKPMSALIGMAQTRAQNRAIAMACDIDTSSAEEMDGVKKGINIDVILDEEAGH